MFLDTASWPGGPSGPGRPTCPSCRQTITEACSTQELRFDPDPVHRLEDMNGLYHAACATPFLSLQRALGMMGRSWF